MRLISSFFQGENPLNLKIGTKLIDEKSSNRLRFFYSIKLFHPNPIIAGLIMINHFINYEKRLKKLRVSLQQLPFEALLVEYPIDLLYLTGQELSTGKLLISEKEAFLIVDGRYFEASSKQSLYPVKFLKEGILEELIQSLNIHSLGFDKNETSYQGFLNFKQLSEQLEKKSHSLEIFPIESPLQQMRLIKDEEEIVRLRAAAKLGYEGYEYITSLLKEGISENELAFGLDFFWKKRGASGFAFDPIIAFGANSSMPHYRTGKDFLLKNSSVLIDIGVTLDNYHSDMTRVVFFGTPPAKIKEIFDVVEEAKNRAFSICRPGNLVGDLDRIARDWISSKGYGEYFTHSLGHGVGLKVHENPFIRENAPYGQIPIQKGMVFTIEPGIYLPNIGGVRLEDTLLITENGYENLTQKTIVI